MGYIFWTLMWAVFGAIMGQAGWQDAENGAMFGLIFAGITVLVFLICKKDNESTSDFIAGAAEAVIDDILD